MKIFYLSPLKIVLIFFLSCIILISCNKDDAPLPVINYKGDFTILEEVGDTLLPTDTCYAYRRIRFNASKDFITFNWVVGDPINTFSTRSFDLAFSGSNKINVKLNGLLRDKKDTSISKTLVIYQPRELTSPLVGSYLGSNTDNLKDTFTVSIRYWFGSRYPWWSDGAYSIDNLPKNYRDTTQNFNEYYRPEIEGIVSSTGYKNLFFDKTANIPAQGIKGYASLHRGIRDTLIVNYTVLDMQKYNLDNSLVTIKKQFVGIKK